MTPEQLAEIIQGYLVEVMDLYGTKHIATGPWDTLDLVSKQLYIDRAKIVLQRFHVAPKGY
jgi:hypothetical protein